MFATLNHQEPTPLGNTAPERELPVFEEVRIENTNLCGYKCQFCPREKMTRPKGIQPVEDFQFVLDRVEEYAGAYSGPVHLHGYGEPLLDPNLPTKTRLLTARWPKALPWMITTLGYKIPSDYLRELVEAGMRQIIVSFYGADSDSYRRLTGVDRFHEAYHNLLFLAELNNKYGKQLAIRVQSSLTGLSSTIEQPTKQVFNRLWSELGLEVTSFKLHNYGNGRQYEQGPGMLCDRAIRRHIFQVTWDLKVIPCCMDYNAAVVFGDLRMNSIKDIVSNSISAEFLTNHRSGNVDVYDICRNCSMRTLPFPRPMNEFSQRFTAAPSASGPVHKPSGDAAARKPQEDFGMADFVGQLSRFFASRTVLQLDWVSLQKVRATPFQPGGNILNPGSREFGGVNSQLPFDDNAFDTVFNISTLNRLGDAALPHALAQIRRVAGKNVWVAFEALPGRDRLWWETKFIEAGFRKHPLSQCIVSFEAIEREGSQITLLFEKVPQPALDRYPPAALKAERDLRMDMLREPGILSDAHLARYTLAREYLKPGMVVLDVACGLGYGSAVMATNTGSTRVIGVDSSQWAVEYAKANYAGERPQLEFRAGDAAQLRFLADASADAVVSFETLEHLPNPDLPLREFARVLKPGGLFIGSVPNLWIDEQGHNPVPYHFHIYDHVQFREQVAKYLDWRALYRQNAGGGWKRPQPRTLRLIEDCRPTAADQQDAEWWIALATKPAKVPSPVPPFEPVLPLPAGQKQDKEETPERRSPSAPAPRHTALNPTTRIVVMDEDGRYQELYGRVFELLSVRPHNGYLKSTEEILESKPDAILLSREWTLDWRLCAAAARRANIPVIYVMDGVIEWSYVWNNLSFIRPQGTMLQPLIASDLCVIGRHTARILAGWGLAPRIHVVGLPRYDGFDRTRVVDAAAARPHILVATAKTHSHNVEQQMMVLRALRDLRDWFASNQCAEPIWRIAAELAEEIGVESVMRGSLADALQSAAALITFPSTCVLEGMLKGLPVAQMDYRPVPFYVASAWEIRSAEHIPNVIQELRYPPPPKLAYQDACLADELENGDASERLAEVVRQALSRSDAYEAACPPASKAGLGRLDYRQVHSELSAFAAAPASLIQYELDAAYATIKRLNREKADRQQELLELAEGLGNLDLDEIGQFSFIDHFAEAKLVAEPPGTSNIGQITHGGKSSRTLFLHPPARLEFNVPVDVSGKLSFAVMLHPNVWNQSECGACRFAIEADGQKLWEVTIDPVHNQADRTWRRFDVPVPETRTGAHRFTFITEGIGSNAYRWAFWRTPLFIWSQSPGGTVTLAPDSMVAGTVATPALQSANTVPGSAANSAAWRPRNEPDAAHATPKGQKDQCAETGLQGAELIEGLAGHDLDGLNVFSFLDHFPEAELTAQPPGTASVGPLTHGGKSVRTIFLHPPARLTFNMPVGAPGKLCFALGLHPDAWNQPQSGTCRFIVETDGDVLCDVTIDPVHNPADRRWFWFDLPVRESRTGMHQFAFVTQAVGSDAYRWAVWRTPLFIWNQTPEPEGNCAEFSPVTLSFPSGLLEFNQYQQYVLNGRPEESPFLRLSASGKPEVQFLVVQPAAVVADYHPKISDADVEFLELADLADAVIVNLVTPAENGQGTVNLQAPLVFNRRTLKGKQVSLVNAAQYPEDHVLPPDAAVPPNFWTCQEMHKVQQRLDGRVRACCMLPGLHWAPGEALQKKRELNENLTRGKLGPCTGCPFLRTTSEKPNVHPNMIDIFTNSFCPVRCWYCEYTKPGGLPDAPPELREDRCGVEQRVLNTQDIPAFIRKFAADAGGGLKTISLSGGDSAYHPQFREIVKTAHEVGVRVVYLSAGVLPQQTEDFCIEEIRAGRIFLSISPDASRAETWARIKGRPAALWKRVVSFVSRATQANTENVIVKMILLHDNILEAGDFIRFWHQQGVRRFALSALFGHADKQLTREQYAKAVQTARSAVENLEKEFGAKLHFETIAL